MRRLLLLSILFLLALAPTLSAQSQPPSPTVQPQASQPETPLYTQAQVDRAIQAASQAAAETAVKEAVPKAVNIALADYSRRIEWTVTGWRVFALAASGAFAGQIIQGPRGALVGCTAGALSAGIYELGHRLFRIW